MNRAALVLDGAGWARLGVGGLAIIALYSPIFPALAAEWSEFQNLSHGFAIPVLAAYLVWARRHELAALHHVASWRWFPLLLVGIAIYAAGMRGGESFLARVSLPLALLSTVFFLSGPRVARQLFPGIAFLLFMVPLPYVTVKALTDQARLFDAAVTAEALHWMGIPVYRNGVFLSLPNITLEVADACSSIPGIAALLALGVLYGFIGQRSPTIRVALALAAIPFGIASNILRIIMTAAGVHLFGRIALDNFIHTFHGTVVFLMTFAALMALNAGLTRLVSRR